MGGYLWFILSTTWLNCAILCPLCWINGNLIIIRRVDTKCAQYVMSSKKQRTVSHVVLLWVKHQMFYRTEQSSLSWNVSKTCCICTKTENEHLYSHLWLLLSYRYNFSSVKVRPHCNGSSFGQTRPIKSNFQHLSVSFFLLFLMTNFNYNLTLFTFTNKVSKSKFQCILLLSISISSGYQSYTENSSVTTKQMRSFPDCLRRENQVTKTVCYTFLVTIGTLFSLAAFHRKARG